MKLHLTATSERGKPITKSGNDWLKIEVVNEDREIVFSKIITPQVVKMKHKTTLLWCEKCQMEMEYDTLGNCIVCGNYLPFKD
jgi:hypothetical protein